MLTRLFAGLFVALLPLIAAADNPGQGPYESGGVTGRTFGGVINYVLTPLINQVIPVLAALAIVLFMYGVIRYIGSAGDRKNRDAILWSLVALFVLFSIWGILRILKNTFLGG